MSRRRKGIPKPVAFVTQAQRDKWDAEVRTMAVTLAAGTVVTSPAVLGLFLGKAPSAEKVSELAKQLHALADALQPKRPMPEEPHE